MKAELTSQIKALRTGRKLTQSELGFLAGMSKSQISRIEKGEIGSPETVSRLLDAMGYKLSFVITEKRQAKELDKEAVLDMLSIYKKNNADRLGIIKLGLFGSFSRGEQGPGSDIDVCIRLENSSMMRLSAVRGELSSIFKREVDLVTIPDHMEGRFFEELNKDVVYV